MNVAPRVVGFLAGCTAVFAVALGVGRLVGPVAAEPPEPDHAGMSDEMPTMSHDVGGLQATADGYTLSLDQPQPVAGAQRLSFVITGPDGESVTAYDEQHERDLHLVVVRRDLTGFQHVHPELDTATGEWSVEVTLGPGAWRAIADFTPTGGGQQVLGADLLVPGEFAPEPLGPDTRTSEVDGYEITLDRATDADDGTVLTASVSQGGAPVTDLEPYLGAYGHLVALREGDVGYLHVHPEDGASGPEIAFRTSFPSAGRYRLFLDFQHGGVVHTAEFTVTVEGPGDGAGEGGSDVH